ncbi:MAG: O-acetylhomoserine aminocarboxypropyltransferase/cysteine synthase family protein [candidate division FCPU426 bacterium]
MPEPKYRFETLSLHAGQTADPCTFSRAVPVYRTSSFVFKNTEHAANLFGLKEPGNIYTRLMNPTHEVLEKRMAALEGGVGALVHASGTAAVFNTIINLCQNGDEVVAARNLYGGTYTMFDAILPQFGIKVKMVDPAKPEAFKQALTDRTRAIYVETIGNPTLEITDLEAVSKIAQSAHVPLVVDSTFTTPYLLRPLEYGADIVVHSLTKWLGGHGTAIGGVVVDGGKFDWTDKKFKLFNEPEPSYHDLRFAHDLGDLQPQAFILRQRLVAMRNLGACLSPDNAWLFLQGLETLPLRMQRHCENALAVARFLKQEDQVSWVRYPGLEDDPAHGLAKRYLPRGAGGMVVFGIKGGALNGQRFIEALQLFSHLANVGDAKSLAIHPASTTHAQLSAAQQQEAGVTPDMIRLSIGLEHVDDLREDLRQALVRAIV